MKARGLWARYGRWALVAGGSEGIGAAFAGALAREGLSLLLVAEKAEPLESVARELAARHGVEVRALVADLATREGLELIERSAGDLELGVIVCNAAVVPMGPFLDQPLEEHLRAIDVNCRAPLWLAHRLAPAMIARGRGAIVIMSSMAGRQGSALFSSYAASKAFDLVLAESLWDELRAHGVDVLGVCAGATRTPGWERSGARTTSLSPPVMEPDAVAREALASLGRSPSRVVGRWNRLATLAMERLLPRRLAIETLGRSTRALFARRGADSRDS